MSKATQAAWYQKNKELIKARAAEWAKNNPERVAEIQKKSQGKHKERIRKYQRKLYAVGTPARAKKNKRTAKWKKDNPEVCRALENKRRAAKAESGGYFTAEEWFILCFAVGFRCLCCGEKRHLEADHVVPVSKGGPSWLWNIQPLCKPCNSSKGNKIVDYRV
jgi:5-methylcytosine-specific restriction endonuclease McrA